MGEVAVEPVAQSPANRVLGDYRACVVCGTQFLSVRTWHRCCSDACRAAFYREVQGTLPLEVQPVPPVVDQRVAGDERDALKGHNAAVLARLRQGPATGADLERLLGPGSAWRTRVSDVRRWLERRGETVRTRRLRPRVYVYFLEAKP